MIRSRPAAIPSVSTPRTVTLKGLGVLPVTTVHPWPTTPARTFDIGTAPGHGMGAAADPARSATGVPARAGAVSGAMLSVSSTPAPTTALLRVYHLRAAVI